MKLKFGNYATMVGFFFTFVQQIIVASSTIMIAKLSQAVTSGQGYTIWLTLFLASLTLVYIPTGLTNYFIHKGKYLTYTDFIQQFHQVAYHHPDYFYNATFRKEREPYFTHEAWSIIQENYDFFLDMFSLIFNVALNVMVMGYFLNPAFLLSYLCAIPITILCVVFAKPLLERRSDQSQKSKNAMLQMLGAGWDTILIGNPLNVTTWNREFADKCKRSNSSQRKLTVTMDVASTVTLFLSACPIFMALFLSFQDAIGNPELLAVLVATTPRQVMTIQHLSDTIGLFVQLNDKRRRTKQIPHMLNFTDPLASQGKIAWGEIQLSSERGSKTLLCYEELPTITREFSAGRYTITGHNGSGKTTLLVQIKKRQGDSAYLLPSYSKLYFKNDMEQREFSTGEKMLETLKELSATVQQDEVTILLLDEWNANLDSDNYRKLDELIDSLSEKFCVIEVLHKF